MGVGSAWRHGWAACLGKPGRLIEASAPLSASCSLRNDRSISHIEKNMHVIRVKMTNNIALFWLIDKLAKFLAE
jgi:hypothetical protein